jgi:hypothetical protein
VQQNVAHIVTLTIFQRYLEQVGRIQEHLVFAQKEISNLAALFVVELYF